MSAKTEPLWMLSEPVMQTLCLNGWARCGRPPTRFLTSWQLAFKIIVPPTSIEHCDKTFFKTHHTGILFEAHMKPFKSHDGEFVLANGGAAPPQPPAFVLRRASLLSRTSHHNLSTPIIQAFCLQMLGFVNPNPGAS